MSRIDVDHQLQQRLRAVAKTAEVRDPNGERIGFFVSPGFFQELSMAWAHREFSLADSQERADEVDDEVTYTSAEVWEMIRRIDPDACKSA